MATACLLAVSVVVIYWVGLIAVKAEQKKEDQLSALNQIQDFFSDLKDGVGFVRALRQMLPDIPVMVASGRLEDALAADFKIWA